MTGQVTDHIGALPRPRVHVVLAVCALEAVLVVAYFAITDAHPTNAVRYLVYPFVWINVGLWAVWRVDPRPGTRVHSATASAVAAAYLFALFYLAGTIGPGVAGVPVDVRVELHAPGWGPLVAVSSPWLRLFLVPFEVVGYAVLSYLLYANVLDLSRGAYSGVFGLVTCVGCTVPVLVPLVGALGGPATSLTTTAYAWSYDLGTLFYVLTVALLFRSHRRTRR